MNIYSGLKDATTEINEDIQDIQNQCTENFHNINEEFENLNLILEENVKKSIITLTASERGKLHENTFDFTFGGGKSNFTGYPMMTNGRILRMGLCVDTMHSYCIAVTVNGVEMGEIKKSTITLTDVEKDKYQTEYKIFTSPIELLAGDVINFKVKKEVGQARSTVVSLLIELDL